MWVGQSYCNGSYGTCRIDTETLETTYVNATSYGVGVDFDGFIWGVPYYQTYVNIIDPGDGAGEEEVERVELGLNGPYTYSDMTGYQLRIATDPAGRYRHVFEGCEGEDTVWTALVYDALTPAGTSITMQIRTAHTLLALPAQPWIPVGSTQEVESPVDLLEYLPDTPHGTFLEVEFTLLSESADARPMLREFEAQWFCDIPIS